MKKLTLRKIFGLYFALVFALSMSNATFAANLDTKNAQIQSSTVDSYSIVDTGQTVAYDREGAPIECNIASEYYGQDANYQGNLPSYQENGDGTVTDLVTGLIWQQDPGAKKTCDEAWLEVSTFSLGGYSNWRIPTIKELYSLILFNGTDVSGCDSLSSCSPIAFIDTNHFAFEYGDTAEGERIIDSQYMSSTRYVSTTMGGDETVFGVNFADGRIKGYPMEMQGSDKTFFVMYVRGSTGYGTNKFLDNGDGTISDDATGLMWTTNDSGLGMEWLEAVQWAQEKNTANYLGYNDWRLPNAKELQSIVDYTRAPSTNSTAAIDLFFSTTQITDEGGSSNYPFYWTGTTHATTSNSVPGANAVYIAFGEGLGWMQDLSQIYQLLDVHGAGCQRSDPKIGDSADYPYGHGPQGDVIRISNFVRLVRGGKADPIDVAETQSSSISGYFISIIAVIFVIQIYLLNKKVHSKRTG
jgi:hypothetical protein